MFYRVMFHLCNDVAYVSRLFTFFCFCLLLSFFSSADSSADPSADQKSNKVAAIIHPPITKGWEPIEEDKAKDQNKTEQEASNKDSLKAPTSKKLETKANLSSLTKIRDSLTDTDYVAALQAIHFALSQVGDGKKYIWHTSQNLKGQIEPTYAFRDSDGRICRHVIYTLFIAKYSKTVEGVACRTLSGRWDLSG